MRKLTILRRSTFVACLGRMSVWFEDPVNPTATIDGRPCRLLGKIKNGETVTDTEITATYLRLPQAERERLERINKEKKDN